MRFEVQLESRPDPEFPGGKRCYDVYVLSLDGTPVFEIAPEDATPLARSPQLFETNNVTLVLEGLTAEERIAHDSRTDLRIARRGTELTLYFRRRQSHSSDSRLATLRLDDWIAAVRRVFPD
mgnify:CR=1 FL=1